MAHNVYASTVCSEIMLRGKNSILTRAERGREGGRQREREREREREIDLKLL